MNSNNHSGPPDKRRKLSVDNNNQDEWDDDNFTEDQLEEFDLMASQVLDQSVVGPPSTRQYEHGPCTASAGPEGYHGEATLSQFQAPLPPPPTAATGRPSGGSDERLQQQLLQMRNQLEEYKKRVSDLREQQTSKDGQITMMRRSLAEREQELFKQRMEKVELLEQKAKEQSDKEKKLSRDVDMLKSQLEFKEREMADTKDAYKKLEMKMRNLDVSLHQSPRKNGNLSYSSPKSTRQTDPSPTKQKSPYPSAQSFMASEGVKKGDTPPKGASAVATGKDEGEDPLETPRAKRRTPKLKLNVKGSFGSVSGPCLMSKLVTDGCHGDTSDALCQGLLALLQLPEETLMGGALPVMERRSGKGLLSPILSRRKQHSRRGQCNNSVSTPQLIKSDHHRLAMQGLDCLLKTLPANPDSGRSHDQLTLKPTELSNKPQKCTALAILPYQTKDSTKGAELLLPLMEDYISLYLEVIHCSLEEDVDTAGGQSKPSSESPDSLSSSLRSFIEEGSITVNSVEKHTLSVVKVLQILAEYSSAVRSVILNQPAAGAHQQANQSGAPGQAAGPSLSTNTEAAAPTCSRLQPTLLLETETLVPETSAPECHLLEKLMQLALPFTYNMQYSHSAITETALSTLHLLATHCTDPAFQQFEPLLTLETLNKCLYKDIAFGVITAALDVLGVLVSAPSISRALCSYPGHERCLLLAVYLISREIFPDENKANKSSLAAKTVHLLSTVVSSVTKGSRLLLQRDCRHSCSTEAGKSLVILLHQELMTYRANQNRVSLATLRQGARLMHTLWTQDRSFVPSWQQVEHQYVDLICGMEEIFRKQPHSEVEMSCVQDLWDFDQGESTWIQAPANENKTMEVE